MISNLLHRYYPWAAYPLGVGVALYLHMAMLAQGVSLVVSTYFPVLLAAGLITLSELYFPNLRQWRPNMYDVKNDAIYMLFIQTALPKILAFLAALALLNVAQSGNLFFSSYWPHHFPVWVQAIMMILIADFFRYWFHVASHKNGFLWRFHAVHHSPKKLYWVNTGRFHPIEKAVQFLLDALPFILLGIDAQVLALYFVFYAVNGFYQHSNIELKFGALNYIISTAELHRWHHSRVESESNSNYGNNTIVWDLLFGTWFLPRNRNIEDIGLLNLGYPSSFLDQLKTPFVGGMDKKVLPLPSFKALAVNGLIKLQMSITKHTIWKPAMEAADNPLATQNNLLKGIIGKNAGTRFGREHGFGEIGSYEQFRTSVPVQTYDTLQPYFDEQDQTGKPAITAEQPLMYAVTSGTTGASKKIPVVEETIRQNKKHQKLFTYIQYRDNPGTFSGDMLGIVSPAVEGFTQAGTPYGAVSGVLYRDMPAIMNSKYVLPFEVFSIEDYDLKYRLILRIALAYKNITYLVSANPSTFLVLDGLMNKHFDEFVDDLEQGGFRHSNRLPSEVQKSVQAKLRPGRRRASELRELYAQRHRITFADIWPMLQTVVTWTGGSCGIALDAVKQKLPGKAKVIELGYMATETRGTITIDAEQNSGWPTIQDTFFEFVEREDWECGQKTFLTIDQLSDGQEYYVFVTTHAGLYRYDMNDIVRVTGEIGKTPALQFIQKGKGVTSITGEKLYEHHVLEAIRHTEQDLEFTSIFYVMLANRADSGYELFLETESGFGYPLETVREHIESNLCKLNIEYSNKLSSGRLRPLALKHLQNETGEQFKKNRLDAGQKESQFKVIVLQYKDEMEFPFDEYVSGYVD